ncbi:protein RTF2 homolog [Lingula anatina]|uniref:Replication termination factor 2 n=1 Tax=Lingula anatina TaxID=7574 RepID=A0A1S3I575_LINAN|nr:protein RTF2 homolog [Lingula anatina]|eukprot:XP_013392986.1 protein RTF2 homolog [Lingula anatina]
MGCDGGTIPRRDELVRMKKKPEQKDKDMATAAKWQHCALTQEKLRAPIVACELGRLYNKEAVIEFLLDKSKFEGASSSQHIKGLKDVRELKLTENPAFTKEVAEKGNAYIDMQLSKYICPVVGLEMNGRYNFCFPWSCGCVVSERAMKEVKSENCHKCGKPFKSDDVVVLNGNEEEVEQMKKNMEHRRLQAKLEKKAKKSGKHKASAAVGSSEDLVVDNKRSKLDLPSTSKPGVVSTSDTFMSSSKLTNGRLDDKAGKELKKTSNGKLGEKEVKSKSIQSDPTTSKVFKSLFTSSEAAKKQPSAHWVTYNPCYN